MAVYRCQSCGEPFGLFDEVVRVAPTAAAPAPSSGDQTEPGPAFFCAEDWDAESTTWHEVDRGRLQEVLDRG